MTGGTLAFVCSLRKLGDVVLLGQRLSKSRFFRLGVFMLSFISSLRILPRISAISLRPARSPRAVFKSVMPLSSETAA